MWNRSLALILAGAVGIVAWRTSPDIGDVIKSHAIPQHAAVAAADPAKAPAVITLYLGGQAYTCRETAAVITCTIPRGLALGGRRHN